MNAFSSTTEQRRPGSNHHRPIILGDDWTGYVSIKVKNFRSLALTGLKPFGLPGVNVPHALGVIEVIGARSGQSSTSLWVGFSRDAQLPEPGFSLASNEAVGTLVLPDTCFTPWLELLRSPQAHFRIGGDGHGNALASELSLLEGMV